MTTAWEGLLRGRLALLAVLVALAMCAPACGEPVVDEVPAAAPMTERRSASSTTATTAPDRLERADARAVTVRIRSIGCGLGTGSGFLLDDEILVTNRHVVEGARELQVRTWDGRELDVRVAGLTHIADLAVVGLGTPLPVAEWSDAPRPVERLASDALEPGDTVYAAGYPGGGPFTVTDGSFVDEVHDARLDGLLGTLRVTADVRPGNSGGPLLDDDGAVVGVVYAIEIATGYGLAVPIETLRQALDAPDVFDPVIAEC